MTRIEEAREFLASIVDGSPEDTSRCWFENAPPEVRCEAFVRLEVASLRKPSMAR